MARMPNEFELSVDVVAEVEFRVGEKTAAWLVSMGWTLPAEEAKDAAKHLVAEGGVPMRWQCRACMAGRDGDQKVCSNCQKRTGQTSAQFDALEERPATIPCG